MGLQNLYINNFKSIVEVEISNIENFSVFAGSNGSGKSNLFEAIEFIRDIVRNGAREAMKKHNGYENIHSHKLRATNAKKFEAKMTLALDEDIYVYELEVKALDKIPEIYEKVHKNSTEIAKRTARNLWIHGNNQEIEYSLNETVLKLVAKEAKALLDFLTSIERYQVDPVKAREADDYNTNDDVLEHDASNLSTVLRLLEKNDSIYNEIIDTMQMIVPGLEKVQIEKENLNNKSVIVFKEEGVLKRFPAGLISDGTIYALAMLTIIYSNQKGIVLIEEPERGLNPKAIAELVEFFRDNSMALNIMINTHSESIVRVTKPEELFLVDKIDGKTSIKNAKGSYPKYDYSIMDVDKMWMSNMFNGGLPW